MAHENMLNEGYEYGDEDVNAVVARIREITKTPLEDGTHVAILDVIASDKTKGTDARNFAGTLNKHTRLNDTDYLTSLGHLLIEVDPVTLDSVSDFMAKNYSRLPEIIKEKVVGRLGFSDGTKTVLTEEEKQALQVVVKKEIDQGTGEDVFDDLGEFLKKGDAKALILFPYNVGNYHWVLGEIEVEREGNNVNVHLIKEDSLADKNSEFSKEEQEQIFAAVRSRLNDIFNDSKIEVKCDSVTSLNKKTQNDGKSCGAFTCHNLALRAEGKPALNDSIPAGAKALRQKQYEMVKPASLTTAKSSGSKWDPVLEKQLQDNYPTIFKNVKDAKLVKHTVQTTDLTDKNLEEFVKSTKALMEKLNLNSEVEVDAPADKKDLLVQLCKKHGLKLASESKAETTKVEADKTTEEEAPKTSSPGMGKGLRAD